jgi:hypothetical protein
MREGFHSFPSIFFPSKSVVNHKEIRSLKVETPSPCQRYFWWKVQAIDCDTYKMFKLNFSI